MAGKKQGSSYPALQARLAGLPSVQKVLDDPRLRQGGVPERQALKGLVQSVIAQARQQLLAGGPGPELSELVEQVLTQAQAALQPRLVPVINATGILVHTNLGRSPLSARALARVMAVGQGYSNLEYDLAKGERGSRQSIVEASLCALTGAEAALVVNNNAAATLLALSALASGKEVVVSRGELVEIGGSFRIPDILEQSGCLMREVGTTNRTHLSDYRKALSPLTGLLLKVHPSNYRVIGFVESVEPAALVALARPLQIPVMEDMGSGCLLDLSEFGLTGEPTAAQRLAAGLDLISMSGDKVLGGPQAGILLGRRALIERCRVHPLARALRIDKLSLAALEGTLQSYREGQALTEVPVLRMLTCQEAELRDAAESLCTKMTQAMLRALDGLPEGLAAPLRGTLLLEVVASESRVGGGAWPEFPLPTWVVTVQFKSIRGTDAHDGQLTRLETWLRQGSPPIVARQKEGKLIFDPRTLLPGEADQVAARLAEALLAMVTIS